MQNYKVDVGINISVNIEAEDEATAELKARSFIDDMLREKGVAVVDGNNIVSPIMTESTPIEDAIKVYDKIAISDSGVIEAMASSDDNQIEHDVESTTSDSIN